jgi:hypothetical protein
MAPKSEIVKVVFGPARGEAGTIARFVELPDGSGRMESWDGKNWVAGGAHLGDVWWGTPVADPATGRTT